MPKKTGPTQDDDASEAKISAFDQSKSFHKGRFSKTKAERKNYETQYKAFIIENRFVKLMGEHSDSPLWDVKGVEMDLDLIELTTQLKNRLIAWNNWLASLEIEDQEAQTPLHANHWKGCAEAGLLLAREIK